MHTGNNLETRFLERVQQDRVPLTLFLMNGFQMRGVILQFDETAVVIDSEGRQQMVYKHAISTVAPIRPITLSDETDEELSF